MSYIIMGVSGSGKSTVGKLLAQKLQLHFIDADDHHLAPSIAKMSQGIPLTDEDRAEWLRKLNHLLKQAEAAGQEVVMACSALKEQYRLVLQQNLGNELKIVFLDGDEALLRSRLSNRTGHFMPGALLASQLETLEVPANALKLNVIQTPEELVQEIIQHYPAQGSSIQTSGRTGLT
ncbi:gluconokinase [Rufibacter sediminis]|uniref:Gluconokinase n=1 Tax=Rufibacter sediminis TaxID=2762756 RepID=A0ABR6VUH7_9BACT|nr:gluconokinase [Rufibacter sediminis]MBC3540276.1 gluconokinase [Rufibacter sediminis]